MSKEVIIDLNIYKTIEYGEDINSIEENLIELLEENGFTAQVYKSDVQDN